VPKLRKEKEDEVKALLEKGYTDIESSEKADVTRQTVAKIRKENDILSEPNKKSPMTRDGIVLSEKQSQRVHAIAHMEGGKDPTKVIDELLNNDATIRKMLENPGTLPQHIKYVDLALKRDWDLQNLNEYETVLNKSGVLGWSPEMLNAAGQLLGLMEKWGWSANDALNYFAKYAISFWLPTLSVEKRVKLDDFISEAAKRHISLDQMLCECSEAKRVRDWAIAYSQGRVTMQRFLEATQ